MRAAPASSTPAVARRDRAPRHLGDKIALVPAARIWAVSAVHGDVRRLTALHQSLAARLQPRDAVVYLGNLVGGGPETAGEAARATLDEALRFRTLLLARRGAGACDALFLRGAQEEMWQRLLELQFAAQPRDVLDWMMERGLGASLAAYGGRSVDGFSAARQGPVALTRWTQRLRAAVAETPGHAAFFMAVRRAAIGEAGGKRVLFAHAGFDPSRDLVSQGDAFWWGGGPEFDALPGPLTDLDRVVRGYARSQPGLHEGGVTTSVDAGCGRGGRLLAACIDIAKGGRALETVEA